MSEGEPAPVLSEFLAAHLYEDESTPYACTGNVKNPG
jgi:hypothetical protein